MNALSDFLLARIAEDEHFGTHDHHLSKRWAAECEAKRRIVRYLAAMPSNMREVAAVDLVLRLMSLPYADHPDYRDVWRP